MTEPEHRIVTSRSDFQEALRQGFKQAQASGAREIFVSDVDFADWPLGEREVVETLTQWSYAHRRFVVLARQYDDLARRHPRWVAWRRQWAHVVDCRAAGEEDAVLPSLLLIPGVLVVRRLDTENHRTVVSSVTADQRLAQEGIDAYLQRSVAAFPASTLGL